MSFWEQMAKTIDASEEKQKKEDLYQKTFHELAEKLSEIRKRRTRRKIKGFLSFSPFSDFSLKDD